MIAGNIRTLGFNHEKFAPPPEINPLYGTESTAWLHIRTKCFWFHAALYVARFVFIYSRIFSIQIPAMALGLKQFV